MFLHASFHVTPFISILFISSIYFQRLIVRFFVTLFISLYILFSFSLYLCTYVFIYTYLLLLSFLALCFWFSLCFFFYSTSYFPYLDVALNLFIWCCCANLFTMFGLVLFSVHPEHLFLFFLSIKPFVNSVFKTCNTNKAKNPIIMFHSEVSAHNFQLELKPSCV